MTIKQLLAATLVGLALSAAILLLLSIPTGVLAAGFTVTKTDDTFDGSCDADCSLREAIAAANNSGTDDSITLPAGTYTLTLAGAGEDANATGDLDITASQALTISGAGADQTIINANGIDRVLHIQGGTTVISGVTIYDGLPPSGDSGGGVYVGNADLTLINSVVLSNSVSGTSTGGGGVYVHSSGDATLVGTQVFSNSVSGSFNGGGGGVYVFHGNATLVSTQVFSNSVSGASTGGGGLHVFFGNATLTETEVFGNSAYEGAGLRIFGSSSNATLVGTQVINNSASSAGGGLYIYSGSATLTGTRVISNTSSNNGGGLFLFGGSTTLTGTQIAGNSALNGGGGLTIWSGSATLVRTQVTANSAYNGGGLYVVLAGASATLIGTQVTGNMASSSGGGLYLISGNATFSETRVISNSAAGGGGLYIHTGSATLMGTQIVSNSASFDGGGVYVRSGSAALTETQVTDNSASDSGGGVYVDQGSAALTKVWLLDNRSFGSGANGSALYLATSGVLTATDGCIIGNNGIAVTNINTNTVLTAADNWWGASDGPSGVGSGTGDAVGPDVLYTPFKTVPPAGCLTPEISVQGNGTTIPDGSTTPSPADGTDFGDLEPSAPPVIHTFVISNLGLLDLVLTGSPAVTLTGGSIFAVSGQPALTTLVPGASVTFTLTFNPPGTPGSFTDTAYIANNANAAPYTFVVGGMVSAPPTTPTPTPTLTDTPPPTSIPGPSPTPTGTPPDGHHIYLPLIMRQG